VIYRRGGHPVIVERPYKRGTILLCADSYLISNEALRSERHPAVLIRLLGPHRHVTFDEAHFGIYKVPGIAQLIRNYKFHWFFLSIALLFILFIWKNSISFIPPTDDGDGDTSASNTGKGYAQGLTSLLRRNIPVKNVLRVSLEEWKKSPELEDRWRSDRMEEMVKVVELEEAVSEHQANPVKGYNAMGRILSEGNSK
jgi:hypothetical protein